MSADLDPNIRMPLAEFRQEGWLMEVNRRVLHPVGLALAYDPGSDSLFVIDAQGEDEDGIRFNLFEDEKSVELLRSMVANVKRHEDTRHRIRFETLGYVTQPYDTFIPTEEK